jgi:HSP20 family molecular chaperone IbpA
MSENVYKVVSDERLIIDVVAPGFSKDAITVKTAKVNGGEAFKITVEGHYIGRKNKDGEPIPRMAFEKYVEDFKYVFSDDNNFGDELFRSKTFVSKDYDLDKLSFDVKDGVIRISIPKTALAKGAVVTAVDNADADSTGIPKTDSVAE